MTEFALRRRMRVFFAELGRADAVAGLPARTSGAKVLQAAAAAFLARYAPHDRWERYTDGFNAYAAAYRRAARNGSPAFAKGQRAEALLCATCGGAACATTWEAILTHILAISHLARAEARVPQRAR